MNRCKGCGRWMRIEYGSKVMPLKGEDWNHH